MLNNAIVMGRLVKDPEVRYTQSQKAVVSFTIACDRDKGEGTDFIDCVAWEKTAEFISKYFFKGSMIIVCGHLNQRSWEDKDGKKRSSYEVTAERVYFGEGKK